jgi:hypothetical protein
MNGREFGEALERAWKARTTEYANMAGQIVSVSGALTVEDVRAALASKDAGPQQTLPEQRVAFEQLNGWWCLPPKEYERLRARDRWIEEHAAPSFNSVISCRSCPECVGTSEAALRALPQDAGEAKP